MRCYGQLERLDIRNVRSTLKTVAGSRLYRRFYGELFESTGLKTRGYLTSRLPDDLIANRQSKTKRPDISIELTSPKWV